MKTKVLFCHVCILSVLCCLISASASASPAEQLMARVPGNTTFLIATSGKDALEGDFRNSYMGQIWYDSQVQNFYHGIVDPLLSKVPEGMDPNEMEQIRAAVNFAEMCIRKPLAIGIIPNADDPETFVSLYFVMETGADKPAYEKLLTDFLKGMQVAPKARTVGGFSVSVPEVSEETPVYWTWAGSVLVAAVNDPAGRIIQSFGTGNTFQPGQAFSGLADHGDVLASYWNLQSFLSQLKLLIEQEEGAENAGKFQSALQKLGLDQVGRLAMRAGFNGPNLSAETLLENPSPPRGLFAQLGTVRPDILCAADKRAFEAVAMNISLAGMYDVILNTIQAAVSPEEYTAARKPIQDLEAELGFSIRQDLLGSLAGPMVGYVIPAYTIPEVPNGGAVLIADLKSPELFDKSMKALQQYLQQQARDQLQIQCQTVSEKQTLCIWASPFLSIMQVMPCWMIQDSKVILATNPSLASPAAALLESNTAEGSICQTDNFQRVQADYPPVAVSLSYSDTAVQMRQMLTGVQQFWPMVAMAATQKGIMLPMILPNLDKYISKLPPAVCYTIQTPRGLESRYTGPGLEVSVSTIGGGAMGAAILMPALSRARETARRVVSAANLKSIGLACLVYSDDHNGKFPSDLEVLLKEAGLNPKILESPYPRGGMLTSGPDYIYIAGQDTTCSPQNVLVYDNPTFSRDEMNVLYVDGHVEAVDLAKLRDKVTKTYENLKRPIPEEEKKRLGITSESAGSQDSENDEIVIE